MYVRSKHYVKQTTFIIFYDLKLTEHVLFDFNDFSD